MTALKTEYRATGSWEGVAAEMSRQAKMMHLLEVAQENKYFWKYSMDGVHLSLALVGAETVR
eukprot:1019529-Pelagomonas_calceolata.AAC.5